MVGNVHVQYLVYQYYKYMYMYNYITCVCGDAAVSAHELVGSGVHSSSSISVQSLTGYLALLLTALVVTAVD